MCVFLVTAALALWFAGSALPLARSAQDVPHSIRLPLLLVAQVPVVAGAESATLTNARGRALPDGSRIVLVDPARPGAEPLLLTPGFVAAGRPALSDDGRHFLFVGRQKRGETLQVFEQELESRVTQPVSHRASDCRAAIYLSTLFTIDAQAPEPRVGILADSDEGVPALFTCRLDGGDERRITFDPFGSASPLLLSDGRLVFVSGETRSARASERASALFSVNVDGTDVQAFAAVSDTAAMRADPCETADGRVIYVEERGDDSARVTEALASAEMSALVSVSVTRSLHSRKEVFRAPSGTLRAPAALSDGRLLVCWRAGDSATSTWDPCLIDLAGAVPIERIFVTNDWHELSAVPVQTRTPRPGRASVVDERQDSGLLYCLDTNITDREGITDPEGDARVAGKPARRVEISRAVLGSAAQRADEKEIAEKILGSAEIEQDGSFHLRVPARIALRVRLLDASGGATAPASGWFWVMPKESRGCIGCHEDRELTPPNRHVLALRRPPRELGSPAASSGYERREEHPR